MTIKIPADLPAEWLDASHHHSSQSRKPLSEFKERASQYRTKHERLALLKEFAERQLQSADRCAARTSLRRARFEKAKRKGRYDYLGAFCWVCDDPSEVRHHVIQIQHGGRNVRDNIVVLCRVCHALIHPWLSLPGV